MVALKYIMLSLIMLNVASCSKATDEEVWISPSTQFVLTFKEIREFSIKAEQGDGEAANKLSNYYAFIGEDLVKSYYWIKKAAENGNSKARENLESMVAVAREQFWESNIPKEKINKLSQKGVKGDADAAYQLYQYYYLFGNDFAKGDLWLEEAAENGSAKAQYELSSNIYFRNEQKSDYWLRKAAMNGFEKAKKDIEELKESEKIKKWARPTEK